MRLAATKLAANHQYRGFGDQLFDKAGQIPNLDLNFAKNKSLIDERSGTNLITFTRASSATYAGSDGTVKTATTNVARFDHNPTTGESLGLLVEEARSNVLLQSNQFDTTWTANNVTRTAAAGIAPDGTNTAWEVKDSSDSVTTNHSLVQTNISFTSGASYTFSCWMKSGTLTEGALILPATAFGTSNCRFNLSTGAVIAANAMTGSSVMHPNGWVRVIATATATATATGSINIRMSNGSIQYIGSGTGTILVWGSQIEAGAFATSYIPTTGTTATRAADVASITSTNFSSWYKTTEGSIFAHYRTPASGTRSVATFNDGTANERMNFYSSTTDPKFTVVDGGVTQADLDGGTISINTETKAALGYAANNFAIASDTNAAVTDTSGTLPTVTQLLLGNDQANNYQNGIIRRLTYWPIRLSNTSLQTIVQ